jgi:hypothetical protein
MIEIPEQNPDVAAQPHQASEARLQKTGTFLHETAGAHARVLVRVLDRYVVDKEAIAARLPPNRALNPCCFYPDAQPTKVVQMNLDDDLAVKLRRQLRLQAKIAASFSDASVGTYFPLSTMFENSVLFIPSAKRFYDLNQDIVHKHFPDAETTVVNAFVVPKGKKPYGTHSASSIALQIPSLVRKKLGFPTLYKSFHTALTPTPLERQPFVIFEDAEVEAPNLQFVYQKMCEYDMSAEEREAVDKALYLYLEGKLSEIDLPTVRDFLMAKYWEKRYADTPSSGYYCDSKVGQALVFDNYRAHADSTLPIASEDRVTIDFRCFSKVEYPAGMSSGLDFIVDPKERAHQIKRKRAAVEFLLMTLGYENIDEFLRMIFGTPSGHINPFELMTDLQFGIYNKSKYHLLDQNLDGHYERVEKLYDQIERDGEYVLPARARESLKALGS